MLAGLGMLVLMTATLAAGAILLNLEYDIIRLNADVEQLSWVGLTIAVVVLVVSTFVGGFVAGRTARYGGMLIGLGSSLWLTLVLALFTGMTLGLAELADTFNGFDLADRLSRFDSTALRLAAAIAAGGLFVLMLLAGLLGGRLGEPKVDTTTVVDVRDLESESPEAQTEDPVDENQAVDELST